MLGLGAGCAPGDALPDPRTLPWRTEVVHRFPDRVRAVDLGGDGIDELVVMHHDSDGFSSVSLRTLGGSVLARIDVPGEAREAHTVDVDGDGRPELLIPFVRDDSLFVLVADGAGRTLATIFLAAGAPRAEAGGVFPWDPDVTAFHLLDTTGDGRPELVTVVATARARQPRGVLVHSFPEGRLLHELLVAGQIAHVLVHDFEADGRVRLLAGTHAVMDGARAGGLDDGDSHLVLFELSPQPGVAWTRRMGGAGQVTRLGAVWPDASAGHGIVVMTANAGHHGTPSATIEVIEPGSWRVLRRRSFAEPLASAVAAELDRRPALDILVVRPPGEVWRLDSDLEPVGRRAVAPLVRSLDVAPDLDGDGIPEIVASTGSDGFLLLGPDLRPRARVAGARFDGVVRTSRTGPPAMLVHGRDGSVVLRLVPNRAFPVYRWAPYGLGTAAALPVVLLVGALVTRRRRRLRAAFESFIVDTDPRGLLVVDRAGRIRRISATLRRWLDAPDGSDAGPAHIRDLAPRLPRLAGMHDQLFNQALAVPHSETVEWTGSDGARRVRLDANPLFTGTRGDPHWVIALTEDPAPSDTEERIVSSVSRRLLSVIDSPLRDVIGALHGVEAESRDLAPPAAAAVDRHLRAIEDRIDELRSASSGFLKLAGLRQPRRVRTDVNAFIDRFARAIGRYLDPDTRVVVRPHPDLPRVAVDPDLLGMILGQLVANAAAAMPDGGVITLSTNVARSVQWRPEDEPRDYVQIEILDVGLGIPRAMVSRIFEPGFTTRHGADGIGLAAVRSIVDGLGGVVTVESDPGVGSAFTVHLPAAAFDRPSPDSGDALHARSRTRPRERTHE